MFVESSTTPVESAFDASDWLENNDNPYVHDIHVDNNNHAETSKETDKQLFSHLRQNEMLIGEFNCSEKPHSGPSVVAVGVDEFCPSNSRESYSRSGFKPSSLNLGRRRESTRLNYLKENQSKENIRETFNLSKTVVSVDQAPLVNISANGESIVDRFKTDVRGCQSAKNSNRIHPAKHPMLPINVLKRTSAHSAQPSSPSCSNLRKYLTQAPPGVNSA